MGDFINDEYAALEQLSWLDPRTCSGRCRLRSQLAHLPDLDLQDRRRLDGALGRQLAPSSRARVPPAHRIRRCPRRQSDRLADHARGNAALLRAGRGQDGRDRGATASRTCPRATTPKVFFLGAKRMGFEKVSTGYLAINSEPRDGRQRVRPDRLLHARLQVRRQVVDALHRDSQGRSHRPLRGAGKLDGLADPPRR